jgi:hypothetical protein
MINNPDGKALNDLVQKLIDAGFESGWAITGETLTVWLHEEDPPAPLKRPEQETQ